jgi:hypothetical protein
VPLQYITSIELNDGTFEAPWSLHEDTVNHRRLCGEGEFDIKGFIALLEGGLCRPVGNRSALGRSQPETPGRTSEEILQHHHRAIRRRMKRR